MDGKDIINYIKVHKLRRFGQIKKKNKMLQYRQYLTGKINRKETKRVTENKKGRLRRGRG